MTNTTNMLQNGRVLVVDDEPLVLEIFSIALEDDGYVVDQAAGAEQALSLLDTRSYDVLVCDVRLEPFDGFEIVEISRKRQPNLGVVFTTGAPRASDAERAKLPNVSYLLKPLELNVLRRAVRNIYDAVANEKKTYVTLNCTLGFSYPAWNVS